MSNKTLSFPTITLSEAIEKVRKLYDEAHRRKMSREEVAKHLGYGGLNGRSVTLISNLSKYGLLEGRRDAIRVSDDAVSMLIEERGAPDRSAAIRRAAARPELFSELLQQFEGGPTPSENAVRIRLEKMGYAPQAARDAARAFRESVSLVEAESGAYNESSVEDIADDDGQEDSVPMNALAPVQQAGSSPPPPPPPQGVANSAVVKAPAQAQASVDPGSVLVFQFPFKGTTLSVRIDAGGQPLTKAHLAKVGQYLKLAEKDEDAPSED